MCVYVDICVCVCVHVCACISVLLEASDCTSSALHVLPVVVSEDLMCAAASLCMMPRVHQQTCIFWETWGKLSLPLIYAKISFKNLKGSKCLFLDHQICE